MDSPHDFNFCHIPFCRGTIKVTNLLEKQIDLFPFSKFGQKNEKKVEFIETQQAKRKEDEKRVKKRKRKRKRVMLVLAKAKK